MRIKWRSGEREEEELRENPDGIMAAAAAEQKVGWLLRMCTLL